MRVSWFTLESLTTAIGRAAVDGTVSKVLARTTRAELIVVDDIGMLPSGQVAAEAFYRLVDATYERRFLAVTSNIHRRRRPALAPRPRHHHRGHLTTPRRGHHRKRGDPPLT